MSKMAIELPLSLKQEVEKDLTELTALSKNSYQYKKHFWQLIAKYVDSQRITAKGLHLREVLVRRHWNGSNLSERELCYLFSLVKFEMEILTNLQTASEFRKSVKEEIYNKFGLLYSIESERNMFSILESMGILERNPFFINNDITNMVLKQIKEFAP